MSKYEEFREKILASYSADEDVRILARIRSQISSLSQEEFCELIFLFKSPKRCQYAFYNEQLLKASTTSQYASLLHAIATDTATESTTLSYQERIDLMRYVLSTFKEKFSK